MLDRRGAGEQSAGGLASPLGEPLHRREDLRLVTGHGRFTADIEAPDALHLEIVRAPRAGAIAAVETAAARRMPGVVDVLTGDHTAGLPEGSVNPVARNLDARSFRPLAAGHAGHVGAPVAAVLAETAAAARDAAEAVAVTITGDGGHAGALAYEQEWRRGDADAAFAGNRVVACAFDDPQLAPAPLEPRCVLAVPDGDGITVWLPTQSPHRARLDLARILGLRSGLCG